MINDEKPEYLDLLARAAKVRHYIARHPGSTFLEIKEALKPMKCPMQWLLNHGYAYRKPNPNPEDYAPIYFPKPMGIPYDINPEEDEELGVASQAFRDSDAS